MVGATGFEPATTSTPRRCATGLRYAPTGTSKAGRFGDATRGAGRRQGAAAQADSGTSALRAPLRDLRRHGLVPKHREQMLHVRLERADHLLAVELRERELDLVATVLLLPVEDPAPRASDGEALVVEELLDLVEGLDVAAPVHPRAAAPLLGTQHLELRLPVTEHVRFDADQVADFADGVVEPADRKRLHGITSWTWWELPTSSPGSIAREERYARSSLHEGWRGPAR